MTSTVRELLEARGVRIADYRLGERRGPCPSCSKERTKKNAKCFWVRIESDRAGWRCHHCGWHGAVIVDPNGRAGPERSRKPLAQKKRDWRKRLDAWTRVLR